MAESHLPTDVPVTLSQEYRHCGKPGCARCAPDQPGHGPYWIARWTRNGRRYKRYVGRSLPPGVAPPTVAASTPGASAPAGVWVQTLGRFTVWRDGHLVPPERWRRRKAGVLFKALLAAPGQRLQREQAITLLWPESDPHQGRRQVRESLHEIRTILDSPPGTGIAPALVQSDGDALALVVRHGDRNHPPEDWLDALAFRQAAVQALQSATVTDCEAALDRYTGPYLPDDEALDANWPTPWLHHQRSRLHELYRTVLQLRALLEIDPADTPAVRSYQALALVLARDREAAPGAEMAALRAQLGLAGGAHPPALFGPLDVHTPARTNLPARPALVGRGQEQRMLRRLLETTRLLTLVGAGGCGKTRLAQAVVESLVPAYRDGVWLVDVAPLTDAAMVVGALAATLGLREEPDRPLLDTVGAFLAARHVLLVLDNCEHLAPVCATLVETLLHAAPHLRVLATSRVALRLPEEEQVWETPPLTVPPPTERRPEEIGRYDAVRLFQARAQAQTAACALTETTAPAVAEICRRLDGLPLALEVAAARVATMPVQEMCAHLDDPLTLLAEGQHAGHPHQRTIQATLDWSYALLPAPARVLLRRLSVFAGGWTRDAAQSVCSGAPLSPADIPPHLDVLVQHSLVTAEEHVSGPRYHLLETVRAHAGAHLVAAGESGAVHARHLAWCVALSAEAASLIGTAQQKTAMSRLEREYDNLHTALAWATAVPQTEDGTDAGPSAVRTQALQLAVALGSFWERRGPLEEGQRYMGAALTGAGAAEPALVVRGLCVAGRLALLLGEYGAATDHFATALTQARAQGDSQAIAAALLGLGHSALQHGDTARAEAHLAESLMLAQQSGDRRGVAEALDALGAVAHHRSTAEGFISCESDLALAAERYDESLALWRQSGDLGGVARTGLHLGDVALEQDAFERATRHYADSLESARQLGDRLGQADALFGLAMVRYARGEWQQAAEPFAHSLAFARQLGARERSARCLGFLGDVATLQGDYERGLACYQESEALYRAVGKAEAAAIVMTGPASIALCQQNYARAQAIAEQSIAELQALGKGATVVFALYFLGSAAYGLGDYARAAALYAESAERAQRSFHGWYRQWGVFYGLCGAAWSLEELGRSEIAARVLGAADTLRARYPGAFPMVPWEQRAYDQTMRALKAQLGEAGFATAWTGGQAMPLDDAIALARESGAG